MTRAEIRSIIRNTLPKYDKSGRYADRYLDAAIEKAMALLYNDVWRSNPLNLQRYTKGYGYTTAIAVQNDGINSVRYSTLPESIIPFQDRASGVRRISTPTQGAIKFYPIDFREMDLIAEGSYIKTITDAKLSAETNKIGYAVNQTRIEYYGMTDTIASAGVRMDLIIPFSKYDETDEVKIPEITSATGETFVDRVLKILAVVPTVDTKDDDKSQVKDN